MDNRLVTAGVPAPGRSHSWRRAWPHDSSVFRRATEERQPNGVFIYVARRIFVSAAGVLWLLACACASADAMNFDVSTTTDLRFSPPSVTITQGDTVTWTNPSAGFHNVHFDDGSFDMPMDPTPSMWSVFQTFTQPGTYTYYCEAHMSAGMTGTVVVNPAPPGGGPPGPGPPPPPDLAPVSSLVSPPKQAIDKLYVRASMNEAGTLTATGTVSVPSGATRLLKFKRVTRAVSANVPVTLRLKLSRSGLRLARRALRHRKKLRAKVTLTATDTTRH